MRSYVVKFMSASLRYLSQMIMLVENDSIPLAARNTAHDVCRAVLTAHLEEKSVTTAGWDCVGNFDYNKRGELFGSSDSEEQQWRGQ